VKLECVKYLHESAPWPSLVESAQACKGSVELDCIKLLSENAPWPSKLDAAKACGGQEI
jgi:hypothetical protein